MTNPDPTTVDVPGPALTHEGRALSPDVLVDGWLPAPPSVAAQGPEVHIWRLDVARWRPRVPALRRLLAPEERARADRFRCEADAQRLIVGRGVLRMLLGDLLHVLPEQVAFSYSDAGKPSVSGIEFSVAHSGDIVLVATHRNRIGIDVECTDRPVDVLELGRTCLTPRERALVAEAPAAEAAFFRLWTRKEAWLKAVGTGLSFPLQRLDVADAAAPSIADGTPIDGPPPSRIVDIPVEPGYAAACALSGPARRVRLWRIADTWRIEPRSPGPTSFNQAAPQCSDWGVE